tara:strand:- start:759 stop:962 length:204 start_codon:yes stop_codon:yes gene_type:complete
VDELASAAKVADVVTRIAGIVCQQQHLLNGVIIDISNAIEGIDKHRVAMSLRNVEADETDSGNTKVI